MVKLIAKWEILNFLIMLRVFTIQTLINNLQEMRKISTKVQLQEEIKNRLINKKMR